MLEIIVTTERTVTERHIVRFPGPAPKDPEASAMEMINRLGGATADVNVTRMSQYLSERKIIKTQEIEP